MLTRIVNGATVALSAAEEAAVRADWAAEDSRRAAADQAQVAADPPLTVDDLAGLLTAKGLIAASDVTAARAAKRLATPKKPVAP